MRRLRELWRRPFGPRPVVVGQPLPDPVISADWCCICLVDLPKGNVYEAREHMENMPEMGGDGGTWVARTYCLAHAPADAERS